MNHYKVNSIEELKSFLERGEHEYVSVFGALRHPYWIDTTVSGIRVDDYANGDRILYTWDELQNENYPIPNRIAMGVFYCETMKFYQ